MKVAMLENSNVKFLKNLVCYFAKWKNYWGFHFFGRSELCCHGNNYTHCCHILQRL